MILHGLHAYSDIDTLLNRIAANFNRYQILCFFVGKLNISHMIRQDYRIIRRIDSIRYTLKPASKFSLLDSRESGIVPYPCYFIILNPGTNDFHPQLLEADTAASVLREVAVPDSVHRVGGVYIRIKNS